MNMTTEADLKAICEEYLAILEKQGKLMFLRLNAGSWLLPNNDGTMRRVKGCRAGTADLLVLKSGRSIFVELKPPQGTANREQREFGYLAQYHGAEYHVAHSLEELQEAIEL